MSVFIPFRSVATVTPIANALLDINAMAESPLILLFSLILSSKNAEITTTGMATGNGVRLNADAIANAPNPTWESPSPIIEYLFNTRLTPNNDAQSETGIPMINALIIKVCSNIDKISTMYISFPSCLRLMKMFDFMFFAIVTVTVVVQKTTSKFTVLIFFCRTKKDFTADTEM